MRELVLVLALAGCESMPVQGDREGAAAPSPRPAPEWGSWPEGQDCLRLGGYGGYWAAWMPETKEDK